MKFNKTTILLGSLLLTISAVLAKEKYGNVALVYISTAGGGCKAMGTFPDGTYTTGGAGVQACIKTASGTGKCRLLWGTNNCATGSKRVHFHG
jgi:hypothetical protein